MTEGPRKEAAMRLLLLMLGISVCVVGIGTRAEAKIIRGARFIAEERPVAVKIAASQHLNNAWKPRAGSAICANRTHNISLRQDRIHRPGC